MMKIAICDDNKDTIQEVLTILQNLSIKLKLQIEIEPYHSTKKLLQNLQENEFYDILFLDIEIDEQSGIDVAKYIRNAGLESILIFISNYDKYLMELFEVEPFRFIKKPIDHHNFEMIFLKAMDRIQKSASFFEYKFKQVYQRIPYKDILYFESQQRLILIHTNKGTLSFYGKLNDVESYTKEKTTLFIRIHQSFYIHYLYIKSFEIRHVTLLNDEVFNISEDKQKSVREHYFLLLQNDYLHKGGN